MGCVLQEDPEDTETKARRQLLIYPWKTKKEPMFSRLGALDEVKWVLEGS